MFNSTIYTCIHNNLHSRRHFKRYNTITDDNTYIFFNKAREDDDENIEDDNLDIYDCITLGASIGIILSIFIFIFI